VPAIRSFFLRNLFKLGRAKKRFRRKIRNLKLFLLNIMVPYWVSYKTVIFNKKPFKFRIRLQNLFFALPTLKRFRRKKDLIAGTRSDPLKVPWIFLFFFWNFQHICKLFVIYRTFLKGSVKFFFFLQCISVKKFTLIKK
jgi:hypothetical protein